MHSSLVELCFVLWGKSDTHGANENICYQTLSAVFSLISFPHFMIVSISLSYTHTHTDTHTHTHTQAQSESAPVSGVAQHLFLVQLCTCSQAAGGGPGPAAPLWALLTPSAGLDRWILDCSSYTASPSHDSVLLFHPPCTSLLLPVIQSIKDFGVVQTRADNVNSLSVTFYHVCKFGVFFLAVIYPLIYMFPLQGVYLNKPTLWNPWSRSYTLRLLRKWCGLFVLDLEVCVCVRLGNHGCTTAGVCPCQCVGAGMPWPPVGREMSKSIIAPLHRFNSLGTSCIQWFVTSAQSSGHTHTHKHTHTQTHTHQYLNWVLEFA